MAVHAATCTLMRRTLMRRRAACAPAVQQELRKSNLLRDKLEELCRCVYTCVCEGGGA